MQSPASMAPASSIPGIPLASMMRPDASAPPTPSRESPTLQGASATAVSPSRQTAMQPIAVPGCARPRMRRAPAAGVSIAGATRRAVWVTVGVAELVDELSGLLVVVAVAGGASEAVAVIVDVGVGRVDVGTGVSVVTTMVSVSVGVAEIVDVSDGDAVDDGVLDSVAV